MNYVTAPQTIIKYFKDIYITIKPFLNINNNNNKNPNKLIIEPINGGGIRNDILKVTYIWDSTKIEKVSIVSKRYFCKFKHSNIQGPISLLKRCQFEYDLLHFLQGQKNSILDTVNTPTPIFYDRCLNLILMSDCKQKGIARYSANIQLIDPKCKIPAKIGSWLNQFHCLEVFKSQQELLERKNINAFTLKYQINSAKQVFIKHKRRNENVNKFLLETNKHKIATLHGDLCPKNILVDKNGYVTLLDFEVCAIGDSAYDLGFFLAHYIIDYLMDRISSNYLNQVFYDTLRAYFSDGYKRDKDQLIRICRWCGITILYRSKHLEFLFIDNKGSLVELLEIVGLSFFDATNSTLKHFLYDPSVLLDTILDTIRNLKVLTKSRND